MHDEIAYFNGKQLVDLGGELDWTGGIVPEDFTVLEAPHNLPIDYWYQNELLSSIVKISANSLYTQFNTKEGQTYKVIYEREDLNPHKNLPIWCL
jgi:AraC-like DNA-binding protein